MMSMLRRLPLIICCMVAVVGFVALPPVKAAAFDPNHIIEDSVYVNTGSMDATAIDNFLNSQPQSCLSTNHGFTTPDPTGWSQSVSSNHGYTFGGNVSGGTAIYHTAQIYHINPQVILATLQYEQGIVGGVAGCHYNTPDSSATYTCDLWHNGGSYTCTTACPYSGGCVPIGMSNQCDAGNCDATYEGFSLQLLSGTWLERFGQERAYGILNGYPGKDPGDENIYYGGPMTQGYRQRSSSSPSIYFDGTYTVNGSSLFMTNGATAARYYYIPSIGGNQSFSSTFTNWFGSPTNVCGSDPTDTSAAKTHIPGDYNGDGKTDIAVFRPSDSCWHIRAYGDVQFGQSGDIPVPGDYNGDGKTDIAVFRPSTGDWHLRGVGDYIGYGQSGDIPVPSDYDGDGKTDAAVYRPTQLQNGEIMWHIRGVGDFAFGHSGDIPTPADYNGDGKTDIAVFRPSDGMWHIRAIGDFWHGQSGDIPVPSDYDGDHKANGGVYRPQDGSWRIRAYGDFPYGWSVDTPAPGDYNGDGKTDAAVFRTDGMWHIRGVGDFSYGNSSDIPVSGMSNAYILKQDGLISSY
jgi:hypothetical protein